MTHFCIAPPSPKQSLWHGQALPAALCLTSKSQAGQHLACLCWVTIAAAVPDAITAVLCTANSAHLNTPCWRDCCLRLNVNTTLISTPSKATSLGGTPSIPGGQRQQQLQLPPSLLAATPAASKNRLMLRLLCPISCPAAHLADS